MDRRWFRPAAIGLAMMMGGGAVAGVRAAEPPRIQSPEEGAGAGCGRYATAFHLPLDVAMRQLLAQDETLATTDAIEREFADRLAGIAVAPGPDFAIDVLLTGDAPVTEPLRHGGRIGRPDPLPHRRGGDPCADGGVDPAAPGRNPRLAAAAARFRVDQRTGTIVAVVGDSDIAREGVQPLRTRLAALLGAPVG